MFDGLSDINDIITFFALAGAIVQVILSSTLFTVFLKGLKLNKTHGVQTH